MKQASLLLLLCLFVALPASAWDGENNVAAASTSGTIENRANPQAGAVTGKVMDTKGLPVVGASVTDLDGTKGTITDNNGQFSLSLDKPAVLRFSFVGYEPQEVNATPGEALLVTLKDDLTVLDDVVVVGYGQQRIATVTGAVSQIKTDDITVAPITNLTQTLAGQLPGLVTKQESGLPGQDDVKLRIRGYGDPLVIIDGIQSDLNRLDPNQVETISILKDGAASIYGARAGNGVVLVTTKRGSKGKPIVQFNTSVTLQGSTKVIRPGSSAQRAQYAVDSFLNSGGDPSLVPYTEEQIQKYKDGTDPNYLNTDWFGASIRKFAPQQNHNVSVSGGTDNVRYYGYFGYNSQETIFKKNGGSYDRFNFQTNFDANVTKRLTVSMDIQYINEKRYYPSGADMSDSNNNFWKDLIYMADPIYPLTLPDPTKLAYAGVTYGSPVFATNTDMAGYKDKRENVTQFKGDVKYDFKHVPGLYAKGTVILRHYNLDQKQVKKQEQFYTYNDETKEYTYVRSSQDAAMITRHANNTDRLVQQYSLNYDKTFSGDHSLSAMLMYEYQLDKARAFDAGRSGFNSMAVEELFAGNNLTASNNSSSSNLGRISWLGRVNYSYRDKYMVETILRADASSRFAKSQRWGYFPSVSAGWNIARENFMASTPVDNLKLRVSYGSSGYDDVANFAFLTGYGLDISYTLGDALIRGLLPTGLANINLTWERMQLYNAGLDFSVWGRKLYGEVDYFYRKRSGIPGSRANSLPSTFGASLPTENLNSVGTSGFELRLGTAGRAGKFSYDITGNIAYTTTKWIDYDEAEYTDPDQMRISKKSGMKTDRRVGYVFDGLFTSQAEIDSWDKSFDELNNDNSVLRPGDAKYKDLNGDGVINWRDQKEIGLGAEPHWTFGLNLNFQLGSFDLSALFQGAFNYTTYIDMEVAATEFRYENYWHETRNNDANAAIPRPAGASTNWYYSTYRNHDTAYMRLKYLSLGYEVPAAAMNKVGISRLRFYLAGTNLFTLSSLSKYRVDPEMPEGYGYGVYYPQQFTMSFGVNLTF